MNRPTKMICGLRRALGLHALLPAFVALAAVLAAAQAPNPAQAPVYYTISLANPGLHLVHVKIELAPGPAQRELQLPVWNALYQVRDFSQYVNWLRAKNPSGQALAVRKVDKSRWSIGGTQSGAQIEYEILADNAGPYGAELNNQHAFFNFAQVLMYPVDQRSSPIEVTFTDVPAGWRVATSLSTTALGEYTAATYDRLVDSPLELSDFKESAFDEAGAHYRIVVHADSADYDMQKITSTVQRIVAASTSWMNDHPQNFLFLYHVPKEHGGGGMEHAYSTAISVNATTLSENILSLAGVTAHEFFHLWNVKRIRPQSVEPIDYTKENYTTALWFSEGFTSTAENYILLRAGLLDEKQYLERLAGQIAELQSRPARFSQSAEEASLDAWLEKYSDYRAPQRSISYYNKGQLLGVMLDLGLREATHNGVSLRELFKWMNQNYAEKGQFFPDSDGVRQAAESVSRAEFTSFFQKYVAGTEEIPWDDFFSGVGLRLVGKPVAVADVSFSAAQDSHKALLVTWVAPGGKAEDAGLAVGDIILELNGRAAGADFDDQVQQLHPGNMLRLKVRNSRREREIQWKLESREEVVYELRDVDNVSPEQKARRASWLRGEAQPSGD